MKPNIEKQTSKWSINQAILKIGYQSVKEKVTSDSARICSGIYAPNHLQLVQIILLSTETV